MYMVAQPQTTIKDPMEESMNTVKAAFVVAVHCYSPIETRADT